MMDVSKRGGESKCYKYSWKKCFLILLFRCYSITTGAAIVVSSAVSRNPNRKFFGCRIQKLCYKMKFFIRHKLFLKYKTTVEYDDSIGQKLIDQCGLNCWKKLLFIDFYPLNIEIHFVPARSATIVDISLIAYASKFWLELIFSTQFFRDRYYYK